MPMLLPEHSGWWRGYCADATENNAKVDAVSHPCIGGALQVAAFYGRIEVVEALSDQGVAPNAQGRKPSSPVLQLTRLAHNQIMYLRFTTKTLGAECDFRSGRCRQDFDFLDRV